MIKKTLCFNNAAYLSLRNEQLLIHIPEVVSQKDLPKPLLQEAERTIPIEDIGVVVSIAYATCIKKIMIKKERIKS